MAEPRNADEWHRRGLERLRRGDRPGAVADLSRAVELAPGLLEAYQARADAYRQTGQHALAVADYGLVLAAEPDAIDCYVGRARCLLKLGEEDAALADLTRALERAPRDATAYLERGDLHCARGDDERGVADLTKAIELGGPPRARLRRGIALSRLGRHDEAIADQDAVLAATTSPEERCHALIERGEAHAGKKLHDRAIADFDAALAIEVKIPALPIHALMNRAWAYHDSGRPERAVQDFDEVLRRRPDHPRAHGFRAEAHGKRGDWGAALADHLQQRERTPDDPTPWGYVCWIKAACPDGDLRNGAAALASGRKACELSNWADHDALDALAAAHAELGQFAEAVSWAEKALALAPPEEGPKISARLELYRAGQPFRTGQ
jgi:tetratricopeptide (TPR) repeat protein